MFFKVRFRPPGLQIWPTYTQSTRTRGCLAFTVYCGRLPRCSESGRVTVPSIRRLNSVLTFAVLALNRSCTNRERDVKVEVNSTDSTNDPAGAD